MQLSFFGAAGTVTGSKYLVRAAGRSILVDCGLFQGLKQLRLKNREPLPVDPASLHAVVLTHAHIDHSGYLPLLVRNGFRGKVYCSRATLDLCRILLPDSGRLQEEETDYANRRGFSKHHPALPLYTQQDAERCLSQLLPVNFDAVTDLGAGIAMRMAHAGHILGAAFVGLQHEGTSLLFSGDLGRPRDPVMNAPSVMRRADYLVVESTYGDRLHDPVDPLVELAAIVNRTVQRGGVVIIPTFAVGRAQELLYLLYVLKSQGRIADIPVYLNSPMAVDATRIFIDHQDEHRLTPEQCAAMFSAVKIVNTPEDSKRLNTRRDPMIILAGSGMATGGRVVHHLKAFAPDAKNTIVFTGFQAAATRGAAILSGAQSVKIHGEYVPVRAEVRMLSNLSAHADQAEILEWLHHFEVPPRRTFITHGEPVAADALRHRIEESMGWRCTVPDYRDQVDLA
ncbi:MAG: MBL fold metallo-hydrolase [Betaproteobacteria bacterium]